MHKYIRLRVFGDPRTHVHIFSTHGPKCICMVSCLETHVQSVEGRMLIEQEIAMSDVRRVTYNI